MKIENVKIVNHNRIIECANIEFENGTITKIDECDSCNVKPTRTVIPGFVNQHIHGFNGLDFMDGTFETEKILEKLAKVGTTSVLPTIMTASEEVLLKSLNDVANAKSKHTRILGIHLEGPFISLEKKGAHMEEYIIKANKEMLAKLVNSSKNMIRKMTIAPENFPLELIDDLIKNNIIPSIGHTNAPLEEAKTFVDAGVLSVTHLWNAMSGVVNRKPGVAELALIDNRIMSELILDLAHVDRSTVDLTIKTKGVNNISLVTDAIRPTGLPDGDYGSNIFTNGKEIMFTKKGKFIFLKGTETIAGSGICMFDSFKILVDMGFELSDIVKLTSYNASFILGNDKIGRISEGAFADIIVLDENLDIDKVFINGEEIK